jgi:hypothetical protein
MYLDITNNMIYNLTQKDWNIITLFINNKVMINNMEAVKDCYKNDKKNKVAINTDNVTMDKMNKTLLSAKLFQNEITKKWDAEYRENNDILADLINMIMLQIIQLDKYEREEITLIIDKFFTEKMKLKELAK